MILGYDCGSGLATRVDGLRYPRLRELGLDGSDTWRIHLTRVSFNYLLTLMLRMFGKKGLRQLTCASTVDHSTLKLFTKLTSLPPRRIIPISKRFPAQEQKDLQPAQNTEIKTCIKPTNLGTRVKREYCLVGWMLHGAQTC